MTAHSPVRADQRPLYAQTSEALRKLVQRGGYAPGERLPSEVELSHQLGISRPTLREALRLLEDEGIIVRRHGVGTFVAASHPVIEGGLEVLESLDRMAQRLGLTTHMAELVVEERPASEREQIGLGLASNVSVTAVTRAIMADGERIAHLTDVVPVSYLQRAELLHGQLPENRFNGSVLDYILGRGWPALSHSKTELSAVAADADLSRALGVARGTPLMRLEAQLCDLEARVVDYSFSHFVPGRFRFHVVRRIG